MFLSNISNDILECIFEFLYGIDKLNLIKADKKLIHNFKINEIKIQLDLSNSLITDNDLSYLNRVDKIQLNFV